MKAILAAPILSFSLSATALLMDDFSGNSIDPAKWAVILPNGNSSVVQGGGVLTTTGRGVLGSVDGFTGPYAISGAFTMLNELEHFEIVFRSDLSGGAFDERHGLFVSFSNDGNEISIQRHNAAGQIAILDSKSYNLNTDQLYSFDIFDYGTSATLAINGILELSVSNAESTGNKIGFYSREFGSTSTALDYVTVKTVPESSIHPLAFGITGLACLVIYKSKPSQKNS